MGVELQGPADLVEAAAALLPPVPEALEAHMGGCGDTPREPLRYRMYRGPDVRGEPRFTLVLPDRVLRHGLTRQDLLHAVEADAKLWITSTTHVVVFVHAGAVSWKGRALLLPGRSGVGKSTLVQALLRRGAEYFSDDYAVLDGEGRVWPCALRLARRSPGGRRDLLDPAELGARTGEVGAPLGWVVDTWFEEGARFEARPLTTGETALRLLACAPAARLRPAEVLHALARACEGVQGWSGPRGEAAEEAREILGILDQAPRPPQTPAPPPS